MKLYALTRMTEDKILKGKMVREWKVICGFSLGRNTTLFGSHCLTDNLELINGFIAVESGWELKRYELREL